MAAMTADQVEVVLRAQTAQYQANLRAADKTFTQVAANATRSSVQVNAATRNLSLNTGNIAAQFQDIGVTAAMGMNPLIIALQQGTQLSAVMNQSMQAGVSPAKALGAAFLQILNPISLGTIAAVALSAAILQGIGQVVPQVQTANDAIKKHREALEGIVDGYEGAESALTDYFDAAGRLPDFAASRKARDQFEELADAANALPTALQDTADYLSALGGDATDTDREIARLVEQFQAGSITLEEFYSGLEDAKSGMGALESAAGSLGLGASKTISRLQDLLVVFRQFGDEYSRFMALTQIEIGLGGRDQDLQNALDLRGYIAEQERLNAMTSEQLDLQREIARQKSNAGDKGLTDEKALELAEKALAADMARADARKAASAGSKLADEYDRERQAVTDLMATMGFDAAMLGQSNREKAIAIALSKANTSATEEEKDAIAQMAGFIYDTEKAIKDLNKSSQEWATTMQSATRGFIDDLIEGKSAAEAFSNVLSSIGSKLIDVGLDSLFGSKGFDIAGMFGGARAAGGPVSSGKTYLVGEKGPELFSPSSAGNITPSHALGGQGAFTFAPVVDARGADEAAVARLETGLRRMANEMVPTIRKEMSTASKKGR